MFYIFHSFCRGFVFQESKKRSLSLSNVAGAYFILIAGLVLSIIVGVIEFVYSKNKPERALPEVSSYYSAIVFILFRIKIPY